MFLRSSILATKPEPLEIDVYMTYLLSDGWNVQFLEPNLKTPVGRIRQLGSIDKVKELLARTPARLDLAAKQAIEHAIARGRGGIYLQLTEEQYRKLADKGV